MNANEARMIIWERLRKVAKPDSRFSWDFAEFITDYEGSDRSAELLCAQSFYKDADVIFITPDNNLERFRERAFLDGKTVLMTNYSISRGFFLIEPGMIPAGKEELASTLDGIQRFWRYVPLRNLGQSVNHVDLMVTGASAITPSGIRFGKGHGYFDLEWAMLSTLGLASDDTAIVAVGHDCQVFDAEVEVSSHDTAVDWIVTTTEVIKTREEFPRPDKGVIWDLLEPDMVGRIPPLQELWQREFCK